MVMLLANLPHLMMHPPTQHSLAQLKSSKRNLLGKDQPSHAQGEHA